MPAYDYRCTFGHDWEEIHPVAECDEAHLCPICEYEGRRVIGPVDTIGAMPSKPIEVGGADVSFTDNASYRRWQAENPSIRTHSTASTEWKNKRDRVRERAEKWAQKRGWRDWDHKVATESQARKEGKPVPQPPVQKES